jgi:RNA polymerase sigma-70 factor (ECF subfamily)
MDSDRQRLIGAARRLLATHADAEDAVQDTYLRAFSAYASWSTAPSAWLHTTLRNTAIDRLRRRRLEAAHSEAAHSHVETLAAPPREIAEELRSDCEAALRHLLSHVSPSEAVCILLRDVFEFDYDEIALALNKSEAASRQMLHRARERAYRRAPVADADDVHIALCWRAIEARDPAPLMELLQTTVGCAQLASARAGHPRGQRSSTKLVHVNGRYALALVLDGVVLCVVPVGHPATYETV